MDARHGRGLRVQKKRLPRTMLPGRLWSMKIRGRSRSTGRMRVRLSIENSRPSTLHPSSHRSTIEFPLPFEWHPLLWQQCGGPQHCATRQSGVMMRQGIHRGKDGRRRKLERSFLAIIWPVASSRFLSGGLWAENATIPCETCTVCEVFDR
jgi:hypothetical protein